MQSIVEIHVVTSGPCELHIAVRPLGVPMATARKTQEQPVARPVRSVGLVPAR